MQCQLFTFWYIAAGIIVVACGEDGDGGGGEGQGEEALCFKQYNIIILTWEILLDPVCLCFIFIFIPSNFCRITLRMLKDLVRYMYACSVFPCYMLHWRPLPTCSVPTGVHQRTVRESSKNKARHSIMTLPLLLLGYYNFFILLSVLFWSNYRNYQYGRVSISFV